MAPSSRNQVRVVMGTLRGFTARKMQELTFAITANLVEDNPLDTGWSRNNWVPRIGGPVEAPFGTRDAVSGAAQGAGLSSMGLYTIEQGPIFISNAVPYITQLNEGHSKQAPAGFVQRSILKGVREVA